MTDQTIPPPSLYSMDLRPTGEEMWAFQAQQRLAELRRQAGERLIKAVCVAQVARRAAARDA